MFDRAARKMIDPPLNAVGSRLARAGIGANAVTLAGLALGLAAALSVSFGAYALAILPLLASRLCDGLDGAVARATRKTDFGGYLDVASDFLFYGAIPLAFAVADPDRNALAAAFLLTAFYFNGTSFLGFAILAERRGLETAAQGEKTLYYSNGLLEGTETIVFFVAICLFPAAFPWLATVFGTLCFVTAALRIFAAWRRYPD